MSATKALNEARAAGIHVNIDGDDLVLEAPAAPSAALLSLLKHYKAGILALLQPTKGGWTAEDWTHFSSSVPQSWAGLVDTAPRPTHSKPVPPLG